jgi:hypothetical protein
MPAPGIAMNGEPSNAVFILATCSFGVVSAQTEKVI